MFEKIPISDSAQNLKNFVKSVATFKPCKKCLAVTKIVMAAVPSKAIPMMAMTTTAWHCSHHHHSTCSFTWRERLRPPNLHVLFCQTASPPIVHSFSGRAAAPPIVHAPLISERGRGPALCSSAFTSWTRPAFFTCTSTCWAGLGRPLFLFLHFLGTGAAPLFVHVNSLAGGGTRPQFSLCRAGPRPCPFSCEFTCWGRPQPPITLACLFVGEATAPLITLRK